MTSAGGGEGVELPRVDDLDLPRALLVALSLAVAFSLVVVTSTSTAAFDPFNPAWEGTSDLRDDVAAESNVTGELVQEPARYEAVDREGSVAFVVSPEDERVRADGDRIREFVRAGGTLVVLENFGDGGNELLAEVGAEARTDGRLLRDDRYYYRSPTMPVATNVENDSLAATVDEVVLNYGTAVEPGNATVLVATSEVAYLVEEPEDELEDADSGFGPHPVATVEDVGEGQVIVVGDPSVTINVMREVPDNAAFLETFYADEERVLFDLPGADEAPPLTTALLTVRETPALQTLLGAVGVAGVATLATWRVRSGLERLRRVGSRVRRGPTRDVSPGLSDEERVAFLRRRYPDWDEDRIERVLAVLEQPDAGGEHADER